MSNGNAPDLVTAILSFMAFVLPLMLIPFAFKFAGSGLHKLYNGVQNGLQNARNRGTGLASKAARNSAPGQAVQKFMNNQKQIAGLKGNEMLRGVLNRNPLLVNAMGGVGGKKYAARYVDAEERKHDAEQVSNLRQGLTGNVATYGVTGGQTRDALARGYWLSPDGTQREVTASDRAAVSKLQQEGYMDQNYGIRGDSYLARASLNSIMDAEIATPANMQALASMVGTDAKQNALFTEMLQSEAGKHGYKNLQYADVSNGRITQQYYVKDPNSPIAGARKVVQSGLSGVNKDALDPSMDMSLLVAVQAEHGRAASAGQGDAFIRKIAEQTKHIDKDSIVQAVAAQLGFGTINPSTGRVTITDANGFADFQKLRSSIKSGGAIEPPARYK
jgi:hypothetical protein